MKITPTILRWLAVAWTIIILIGCLTPHSDLPDDLLTLNDKVQHVSIFAMFAMLWCLAGYKPTTILIMGVLFGALIEILQYLLPINRSADWLDLAADTVGVAIGVLLARVPSIRNIVGKSIS